jgi:VanZ family protein
VVVVHCAPFRVSGTRAQWRARYEGFWALPFARLYRGSEFNAVSDSLRKLLLFAGLGALLTMAITALNAPPRVRLLLLAAGLVLATGLAASIELLQVVLPPHVPDVTDVVLGALGAAAGAAVTWRIVSRERAF